MSENLLTADGAIDVEAMIAAASKGGEKLFGTFTCRLKEASVGKAFLDGGEHPTFKTLTAIFTILSGEHEKEDLYVRYKLFNANKRKDGTQAQSVNSGTVRFFTDLAALGELKYETKNGKKLIAKSGKSNGGAIGYDKDGNIGVFDAKGGVSTELLKKMWMERVVGKIIDISSEEAFFEDKSGTKRSFADRRILGLHDGKIAEPETADAEAVAEAGDDVY